MADFDNTKIFDDYSYSELFKEIYYTKKQKDTQISALIDILQPLIKSLSDATIIVPLIREYMDISVRNDEMLIKMAAIIQRNKNVQKAKGSSEESEVDVTKEEIEQLLKNVRGGKQLGLK